MHPSRNVAPTCAMWEGYECLALTLSGTAATFMPKKPVNQRSKAWGLQASAAFFSEAQPVSRSFFTGWACKPVSRWTTGFFYVLHRFTGFPVHRLCKGLQLLQLDFGNFQCDFVDAPVVHRLFLMCCGVLPAFLFTGFVRDFNCCKWILEIFSVILLMLRWFSGNCLCCCIFLAFVMFVCSSPATFTTIHSCVCHVVLVASGPQLVQMDSNFYNLKQNTVKVLGYTVHKTQIILLLSMITVFWEMPVHETLDWTQSNLANWTLLRCSLSVTVHLAILKFPIWDLHRAMHHLLEPTCSIWILYPIILSIIAVCISLAPFQSY